ncbi:MAG TPA: type III pantothenate kinase [Acidimicrobiales bacterium]|nr:type III pantothenate kinase [Acidimicrobiales bacterium]
MRMGVVDVGNSRTKRALFDGARLRPFQGPVDGWIGVRVGKAPVPKGTLLLGRDFPALVKNRTRRPEAVGGDRLAQASAAWYRTKAACVVVSMGTAITKDFVNARGEFVGGVIAPGLRMMARGLHEHTALLPEVRFRRRREIGRDTVEAIQAGLSFAAEGVILRSLPDPCPVLFGTGGDAALFRDHFDVLVPDLALEGVVRSWQAWRS